MSYFARGDELPEWVARIPDGWGSDCLKWSVDLSTRRSTEEEQEVLPYISNEHLASWTGKLLIDEPKPAKADSRTFRVNDILFNKLGPHLAKVYRATFDGASSGELLCLRPLIAVDPPFLFYVLASKGFIDTINAETFGSTMPRTDWETIGHQPLPLPPLDTQRRITRFLDEKTALVDGLIKKKRELLDRLAEMRQALITDVVTVGLKSDARRRDRRAAHVAGEISSETAPPSSWSFARLKYLATYNDEVLAESTDDEVEIDYVEIAGVSLHRGIHTIQRMTFGHSPSRARRKVQTGDILISTVRTYLRAIAKVDYAFPDLIASTGFCVVRPNDEVDSGFLGWAAKSEPFVSEVVARSVGVSYPAINSSDLVSIRMPAPPLDTQHQIARYLDEKTARIDASAKQILRSIDLLSEYRSALVTAAVTGQCADLQ